MVKNINEIKPNKFKYPNIIAEMQTRGLGFAEMSDIIAVKEQTAEKTELQARAERRFAEFIGTVHDIERAGRILGRPDIMLDFLSGLTSLLVYIENGAITAAKTTTEKREVQENDV